MEPHPFLHNLLLFGRILRELNLDINPGRMLDLVKALQHINLGNPIEFYHAVRSLLVHRYEDLQRFDLAFLIFWEWVDEEPQESPFPAPTILQRDRRVAALRGATKDQELQREEPPADHGREIEVEVTYSRDEILRHKDFAELDQEEIARVKQMMENVLLRLGRMRTRRFQPGDGSIVDLRRTLRKNLRHGGTIMEWTRLTPKMKPRPIVILADISGSMARYTQLLLHFILAMASRSSEVEAFVFGTQLSRITRQIHRHGAKQALHAIGRQVPDVHGGTRIGSSLKSFNFNWARRVLHHAASVLLISDGWDRGDIDLLSREMARLQRSCHRLIWLNPLLGSKDYEPLTRGMQAALPFIDDFLPIHNLVSLEILADHLLKLSLRRPARRQHNPLAPSGDTIRRPPGSLGAAYSRP